jgi:hypothetical protein
MYVSACSLLLFLSANLAADHTIFVFGNGRFRGRIVYIIANITGQGGCLGRMRLWFADYHSHAVTLERGYVSYLAQEFFKVSHQVFSLCR